MSRAGDRYDAIGRDYAAYRVPDPRLGRALTDALGDARTVLNVGAGTGAYEPTGRAVVAVEPSRLMAAQRPPHLSGAVLATAERLPFTDSSFDAAMAVLTIHHWTEPQQGIRELVRVARRRVALLTIDISACADFWLYRDYLPHQLEADRQIFPTIDDLRRWLGPRTTVAAVPVSRDCSDGFLLTFWSRPEALLDPAARRATSGFALMDDADERRVVDALCGDLASGRWDRRHGHLRDADAYDGGLRLVVAELA